MTVLLNRKENVCMPACEIKVLGALSNNKGSSELLLMCRLARAFAACIHKSMDVDELRLKIRTLALLLQYDGLMGTFVHWL